MRVARRPGVLPVPVLLPLVAAVVAAQPVAALEPVPSSGITLDLSAFRPVEGPREESAVYYHVVEDGGRTVLRGLYAPGMQSVTLGVEIPEDLRHRVRLVRWSWRALAVPERGDECRADHGDSAASVALAFRRGMRWYVLKYVWSGASPLGAVCDRKRSAFLARDTIVLERGTVRDRWLREVIDVRRAFVDHFAGGDPGAEVPDLVGIAVMTDGDQTASWSGAEWADFELVE